MSLVSVEQCSDDFPFYNGNPVCLSGWQWAWVLCGVVLGFVALVVPFALFLGGLWQFVPALLFVAIPLAALAWVTPRYWTRLFRRITALDVLWMVVFALLNIAVTVAIGWFAVKNLPYNANPAFAALAHQSPLDLLLFFLKTVPQLVGEEVLTILPFLALMSFFTRYLNRSRQAAMLGAWLLAALLFAAAHLPTYGWNVAQTLLVIGVARLVLLLPYLMTKNLWVSAGAHILNDWALFSFALLGAGLSGH